MEEENRKVIHEAQYFDVVQSGSMVGIEPHDISVVVMAFERDPQGLPKNLGILKEYNPLRNGNYSKTLVTGRTEEEDPDILTTAMREFKEESGYDVQDPERWCFLGFMTGSKMVDQEHPCFAVDITELEPAEKTGDGTEQENKSEFKVVTVKEALDTTDCFIPTLFMKMFKYIYSVHDWVKRNDNEIDVDKIRQELDKLVLPLSGVNGSLLVTLEDGIPSIEYTVSGMSEEDRTRIPSEYNGIKIIVKEVGQTEDNIDGGVQENPNGGVQDGEDGNSTFSAI